ncbi:MAG: two-component sensor histidine kinase [Deltaproteobacteria bacterium]|nr:two-component sensor histidine kinase [Deltaproteobacteria bacterium]MBW1870571.1 two-component sensor histidine kinase [Deltaproteobacteria bacterium]
MNWFSRQIQKLIFTEGPAREPGHPSRYRRMWRNTVITVAAVAIIPLLGITFVNYYLYHQSFQKELTEPILRITSITKRSLESFLEERIAAAKYVSSREKPEDLFDQKKLAGIFSRMRKSFGGIVDIGVIDSTGIMRTYAGPYDLAGKNYRNQDWFDKMLVRGVYVSDVFLGHRQLPHFIVAVKNEDEHAKPIIFRATIDMEWMVRQIQVAGLKQNCDVFLLNQSGSLQTPSRLFGEALSQFPGRLPRYSEDSELIEEVTIQKETYLMGYAYIAQSPFLFVIIANNRDLNKGWLSYQREMLAFLAISIIAIVAIIMGITTNWVTRIKEADQRREASLHNIEHQNRMASIGRLAAGVAHEINNPMAIINEKAGLVNDLLNLSDDDSPLKEKLRKQTDSIIKSVARCSEITHRLLGFARHMDVKHEPVAVDALIRDVLGFLEKEAVYRDIQVEMSVPDSLPTIHSDKGQLQQLFLNLINNAFDAMHRNGRIDISVVNQKPDKVVVAIRDSGVGIPQEHLDRIFEPFFTTKKSKGTGLGLSITYGIVQKLRGSISVESEIGKGTTFTVTLPVGGPA